MYNDVEKYISEAHQSATPDKKTAVGFVMTIYRRRLASSFFALQRTLNDRLAKVSEREKASGKKTQAVISIDERRMEEDLPQDESADEQGETEEAAKQSEEALAFEERGRIQQLLKAIAKLSTDSKALRLVDKIKEYFATGSDAAIVFTQYTDTLDFLKDHVSDKMGVSVGCYSGDGGEKRDLSGAWQSCSKEQVKRMLRERRHSGHRHFLGQCGASGAIGQGRRPCRFLGRCNRTLPGNRHQLPVHCFSAVQSRAPEAADGVVFDVGADFTVGPKVAVHAVAQLDEADCVVRGPASVTRGQAVGVDDVELSAETLASQHERLQAVVNGREEVLC